LVACLFTVDYLGVIIFHAAFKTVRKETNDSSDEESMDEEDLTLIVRQLNRLLKSEKNPRRIQCHECGGYGHIRAKYANLQGNAYNVTHSDEYDKDDPGKGVNYLAFTTYKSPHESSKYPTPNPHDSSENESEEEDDLQNTYFFFLISK